MPNQQLRTENLYDIAEFVNGRATKPSEMATSGLPVIKIAELSRGITSQTNIVPAELVQSKHLLKSGDLLFAWSGSIGIHKYGGPAAALNQHIFKVLARDFIDQDFLQYFLEAQIPILQGFVDEKKTTMGHVTIENLKSMKVSFPKDIELQKSIARILRVIDLKIETNHEIALTLEQIAQTVFKSWFVDFEPVHAKARGEQPVCMDAETAALFPDSFEESELGPIPTGWRVETAGELYEMSIGRTPPRKEPEWFCPGCEGVPWVSIRDMGTFGLFSGNTSEGLTEEAVAKFRVPVVPADSVLMSFKLTVGKLCVTDRPVVTNEAIAHFKQKDSKNLGPEFTYLWLKQFDVETLDSTSSIATATNSGAIRNINFLVPSESLLSKFEHLVTSIFTQIRNLGRESQSLIELRDSLLPRLISGELEIPAELLEA